MHRFWQVYVHLIWSTKKRIHIIKGDLEKAAHAAIRETAREHNLVPICVNSAWNHTHSLLSWSPGITIEDAVKHFKAAAADRWNDLREEQDIDAPNLDWQIGYSAFSVNPKRVGFVREYVARQKDHHRNDTTIEKYERW